MDSLKKTLLFFLLPVSLAGQVSVRLAASNVVVDPEIHFIEALDSTQTSHLGFLLDFSNKRVPLALHGGKSKSLYAFFKQSNGEQTIPFLAVLKKLEVKESDTKETYTGKVEAEMVFYALFNSDTVFVHSAKAALTYKRNNRHQVFITTLNRLFANVLDNCLNQLNAYLEINKNRLEVFCTLTQIEILPFRNRESTDTLYYGYRKMSWTDFRAKVSPLSAFAAVIFPSFELTSKVGIRKRSFYAEIEPSVFMVPSMSWVKNGALNEESLKHEQLHFDIAYLSCLKLLNLLNKIQATSLQELEAYLQFEYLEAFKRMNKLQEAYDFETAHGRNRVEQYKWEEKIEKEIMDFKMALGI